MGRTIDLVGQVFGRLTVLERAETRGKEITWLCVCSCGGQKTVRGAALRGGITTSCGCLQREVWTKFITKHGAKGTRTYRSWSSMMERCCNPRARCFKYYGGRGITVCRRWLKFENFLADMGERPAGLSLDRKKNHLGYSKSNCRWATRSEQMRNTRRNRLLTYKGETLALVEWRERLGLSLSTLKYRLKHGWSMDEIVNTPPHKKGRG